MRATLITILFLYGCEQPNNSSFIGSWNYCSYVGQYNEIHISKSELINIWMNTSDWHNPKSYEMHNDTLVYYDTLYNWHDENGNPSTAINQFVLDNNKLVWVIDFGNSKYNQGTYSKMPIELIEYQDNETLTYKWSHEQFEQRERKFNCQDLRTEKEMKSDSIEMNRVLIDLEDIF